VNILAVILAAVSSFMLGGLWYSKALFGDTWNREMKRTGPDGKGCETPEGGSHPARVFGVAFAFSLIAAFAFAALVGPAPALDAALKTGALAGLGIAATSFGINYQFAQHSFKLLLIDGGYHAVQFVLFGLILGLWH
jgi:hypothetical protein